MARRTRKSTTPRRLAVCARAASPPISRLERPPAGRIERRGAALLGLCRRAGSACLATARPAFRRIQRLGDRLLAALERARRAARRPHDTPFWSWLDATLQARGQDLADACRAARAFDCDLFGLTDERGQLTPRLCLALARILDLPRQDVFRVAGMLWPLPEGDTPTWRLLLRRWPLLAVLRALPALILGRAPYPGLARLAYDTDRVHPHWNPRLCHTYRRADPELRREMTRWTPWLALACAGGLPEPRIIGGDDRPGSPGGLPA